VKSLILGLLSVAVLAGQSRAVAVAVSSGALGGRIAPTAALTRPLGGVASPGISRRAGSRSTTTGSHYVGPVYYIPNAYDSTGYSDPGSGYLPQSGNVAQPIIVNQYFLTPGSSIPGMAPPEPEPSQAEAAPAPGDLLAPPASYYLIAYKDRSIYSALTYWLEGDTLHYVTTQNTHNQASLSLIDIDRTYKLNADQSVPFTLPGK
jgi:hypothetical protein